MEETIKIDKDYLEAYNLGYELSKELNLKPDILKGLSAGKYRVQAMKEGMEQYQIDKSFEKGKDHKKNVIPHLDIDKIESNYIGLDEKCKDKTKGLDMEY